MSTSTADWQDELDEAPDLRGGRALEDPDMDITPMIDVTFLLLIFFIVCSNIDSQSPIELAKARNGVGVGERESIVIEVLAGGVDSAPVMLEDGTQLSEDPDEMKEELRLAIEKVRETDPSKIHAMIKADGNVSCRDVRNVAAGASKVEGMNIHFAVRESDK
ncbi:ExbD/TolR family protein [Adhaeretor mobilis]|uniref:Biopolymer transport protein ExbD/TolR n=1 Tax=Adhaeretor mobilis TaxID=1930276 RepID=A0A517MX93_9BACT|nr:biopolymer transporter ExbD [Adhaeretor mobilis]QDS99500.1 Biopolymer transport protein ExbD/TolR [Adhaeretor mobilis]